MKTFREYLSETAAGFTVDIQSTGTDVWDFTPMVDGDEIGTMTVAGHAHELQVFSAQIYRQFRRKGYGKKLYQAVLDFAHQHGYKTLVSGNSVSTSAQQFWKDIGGQEFKSGQGLPRWSVPTTHKITGHVTE